MMHRRAWRLLSVFLRWCFATTPQCTPVPFALWTFSFLVFACQVHSVFVLFTFPSFQSSFLLVAPAFFGFFSHLSLEFAGLCESLIAWKSRSCFVWLVFLWVWLGGKNAVLFCHLLFWSGMNRLLEVFTRLSPVARPSTSASLSDLLISIDEMFPSTNSLQDLSPFILQHVKSFTQKYRNITAWNADGAPARVNSEQLHGLCDRVMDAWNSLLSQLETQNNQRSEEVLQLTIFLWQLCRSSQCIPFLVSDAIVSKVNHYLHSFADYPDLLEHLCVIIRNLATASSPPDPSAAQQFMDFDILTTLCSLLEKHCDHEGCVTQICAALWNLSFFQKKVLDQLPQHHIFPLLAHALAARLKKPPSPSDADLFFQAFGLVLAISWREDVPPSSSLLQDIVDSGFVPLLVESFRAHIVNEKTIEHGCDILWHLSHSFIHAPHVVLSHAIPALLSLLSRPVVIPSSLESIIGTLATLSVHDIAYSKEIVEENGIYHVLTRMKVHMDAPNVVVSCLSVLRNLVVDSGSYAESMLNGNVLSLLEEIMPKHLGVSVVQTRACALLRSLAARGSPCAQIVKHPSLMAHTLIAVNRYPDVSDIQIRFCGFLSHLARHTPPNASDRLYPFDSEENEDRGLTALIQALKHFPRDSAVLDPACSSIGWLSATLVTSGPARGKRLIENGAVPLILHALFPVPDTQLEENRIRSSFAALSALLESGVQYFTYDMLNSVVSAVAAVAAKTTSPQLLEYSQAITDLTWTSTQIDDLALLQLSCFCCFLILFSFYNELYRFDIISCT